MFAVVRFPASGVDDRREAGGVVSRHRIGQYAVVAAAALALAGCGPEVTSAPKAQTTPAAQVPSDRAPRSGSSTNPSPDSSSSKSPATRTKTTKSTSPRAESSRAPAKKAADGKRSHAFLWPVIRVVDGDTVHVRYKGRDTTIRIIGIDTPETVSPSVPDECGGQAASAMAHRLLDGKKVRLEFDAGQGRQDKYGRTLAYVFLPRAGDYGLTMIRKGLATEYTYATAYRYQAKYRSAKATAEAQKVGTWGACGSFDKPLHTAPPQPRHTTPTHAPKPTRKPAQPAQNCTPGYSPCLPPASDWDCGQLEAMGLTPVRVTGSDPYRLDADGDGTGCDS